MTDPQGTDAIVEALARLDGTGFEFGGYLSNHGPMASDALVALGAGDEVPGWVERYLPMLDGEPEPRLAVSAEGESWQEALGDFSRVADWTVYFGTVLTEATWTDVLATWWPRLLPGLAAAATHGVIRTAHAVRAIDRAGSSIPAPLIQELAHGLGYWAARYRELPGHVHLAGTGDVAEITRRLPRLGKDAVVHEPGIVGRMAVAAAQPDFATTVAELGTKQPVDRTLSQITATAARVFVGYPAPAIPLVHAVTAPAALRMVLKHLPPDLHEPSLAAVWHIVAAIIAAFSPLTSPPPPTEPIDPEELRASAIEHADEHVIKFTEACCREDRESPDPYYLLAAQTALSHIDPLR